MKKFMFMNRKAPYGTIYALESLEVVLITATFDQDVSLVFMDDGVAMEAVFGDGRSSSGLFDRLLGAGNRLLTGESLFTTVESRFKCSSRLLICTSCDSGMRTKSPRTKPFKTPSTFNQATIFAALSD